MRRRNGRIERSSIWQSPTSQSDSHCQVLAFSVLEHARYSVRVGTFYARCRGSPTSSKIRRVPYPEMTTLRLVTCHRHRHDRMASVHNRCTAFYSPVTYPTGFPGKPLNYIGGQKPVNFLINWCSALHKSVDWFGTDLCGFAGPTRRGKQREGFLFLNKSRQQ